MKDGKAAAVTMPDWLGQRAASLGDRLALMAGDERLTFAELDLQVAQTARRLAGLGVAAGVRVALLLRNGAPFVVLTHALVRLGAVMVPLNARLAAPEVTVSPRLRHGLVVDEVLAEIRQAKHQLLVIGAHRPPIASDRLAPFLDDVADQLLTHAPCSVLIVRA